MSRIKPFSGYRPPKEAVCDVAAPPYDVLSVEEARILAAPNPRSFLHVTRAEVDLDPAVDPHSDEVYARGAESFRSFLDRGLMRRDEKPCLYLYRLEMEGRAQTGVVAGVSVDEYDAGLIRKHELTRPDKEEDRTRHMLALGVNPGPVFLTYRASREIDELSGVIAASEPEYDFTAPDGVRHTFWVVDDAERVAGLTGAFGRVPRLYIADGHHRASVASIVAGRKKKENSAHRGDEPYNHFLAVMFPHDQLRIMAYNRVVRDLGSLSAEEFLRRVDERFRLEPSDAAEPERRHRFKMFFQGSWHALTARPGIVRDEDPVKGLDVSILQDNLLGPVLGIEDPRRDRRIDFVGGIRGMAELEARCRRDCMAAFALYPMSVEELLRIADAGMLVPPKSTWFEPKLRSGLVVKPLD
jgi:uncharacterized protein (DUF1015 family)